MASLFPKIYTSIDQNPHKTTTLRWNEPSSTEGFQQESWDSFSAYPLDPPGALSLMLLTTDPMFELASLPLRKKILTEQLLILQKRVETELVGRRFPRKKIQDLLAGQVSAETPTHSPLLEEVLCQLFSVQKVHIHRKAKTIQVYPPDLRQWSKKPLLFAEEDNCWNYTPNPPYRFLDWLLQKEDEGWTIGWPTADGTLEELKGALVTVGMPVLQTKQKKEEIARIVGRAQAIRLLGELGL